MDKFGRRPKAKDRRRKLLLYGVAFLVPAACFAVLFGFGNAGAPWVIGFYLACLTVGIVGGVIAARRRLRLWLIGFGVQPEPREGFTTLEVAAINDLIEHSGPEGGALRSHFRLSEAVLRYNSGTGCVTTVRSDRPQPVSDAVLKHVSWYRLNGLPGKVGCKFWASDGVIDLMEIFCGGEDTRLIDWTRVTFIPDVDGPGAPRIPESRPIVTEPHLVRFRMDEA